jgi:DNA topoisomerase-6 subunit B
VAEVNWRAYGLAQAGLPQGPILILVHVASTNVPFTSESKDAIAAIPEIEREVTLALQDLGRDLKSFVSRRDRTRLAEERARAVCAILPELAAKVAEVTERPLPDISPIEGQIMRKVVAKKRTVAGCVEIEVQNHTGRELALQVFEQSGDPAEDAVPAPDFSTALDDLVTRVWQVPLAPGGSWRATYTGNGSGTIDLRGVDEHQKVVVDLDV